MRKLVISLGNLCEPFLYAEFVVSLSYSYLRSTSATSNCSGNSTTAQSSLTSASLNMLRSLLPLGIGISTRSRDILQNVLAWQIVPSGAPTEPSMLWGAPQLARLIIKLPMFLNQTGMADEKLKTILNFVDTFIE